MAQEEIIIKPSELWGFCQEQDKKGEFESTIFEIANNKKYGISVCVSKNDKDRFCISVEADGSEVYTECIVDEEDATKTCSRVYYEYLTDKVIETLMELEEESSLAQMDEIEIREEELDEIVTTFIMDVLGGNTYFDGVEFGDIVDDCKEHFLEYMARKHGLAIYRPMILEDNEGEFFEEYPYESMEFEDENNPIYKS